MSAIGIFARLLCLFRMNSLRSTKNMARAKKSTAIRVRAIENIDNFLRQVMQGIELIRLNPAGLSYEVDVASPAHEVWRAWVTITTDDLKELGLLDCDEVAVEKAFDFDRIQIIKESLLSNPDINDVVLRSAFGEIFWSLYELSQLYNCRVSRPFVEKSPCMCNICRYYL